MARPRIEIDRDQFEKLCFLQCTLNEIASFFHCSEDTVERWCKREMNMSFADAFKTHSAGGKMSLRRAQWKSAEAGNVTMQIWLGKQWLGQKEQSQIAVSNNTDDSIKEMEKYFADKQAENPGSIVE